MSIIAYYAHVDDVQLQTLRQKPAIVWNIKSDPRFAKAALLDVDKDYEVVAWLISGTKRKEQALQIAYSRANDREIAAQKSGPKAEFERIRDEELKKLGAPLVDENEMTTDLVLNAIEGRGKAAQRDPKLNFGLGSAFFSAE